MKQISGKGLALLNPTERRSQRALTGLTPLNPTECRDRRYLTGLTWLVLGLLCCHGCTQMGNDQVTEPGSTEAIPRISYPDFVPVKIGIVPLTRYVVSSNPDDSSYLKVYVELLDNYNSQIKYPGTFRFELYSHVSRSVEPKGQRIAVWPDMVLTNLDENNRYWREFLRAYEFRLDYTPQEHGNGIFQATFITPEGKRLTSQSYVSLE